MSAGDSASVDIPAGALAANTTITVTSTAAAAPTDTVAVGTPYVYGPEGTQFAVPVTVTLAFTANLIPAGQAASDVVIFTAPAGTTTYQALPTTVADESHVSAQTTHFSIFVPAVSVVHEDVDAGVRGDAAIDASSPTCTPVKVGDQQACTFTASCDGHTYEVACANAGCSCIVDNGRGMPVQNVGTTCSGTTGQPGWGVCGFP